jgi:hypothetical protein
MRRINLILFFGMCWVLSSNGQTQSLADPVVASMKATVQGLLYREYSLKIRQRQLLTDLRREEADYASRTGAIGNISNSIIYAALYQMMGKMDAKIAAVEHNISIVRITRLGFRHGLKGFETSLANEKGYFQKLKQEYSLMNQCLLISGGSGYNFIAFLKLLLRTMQIRHNVLLLDKQVKSLMNLNLFLAK